MQQVSDPTDGRGEVPPRTGQEALVLHGVSKAFPGKRGAVQALLNVSLTVNDGEFITILGPSGCGKTTLLRLLAGLTRADEGHILSYDRPITGPGPDRAVVFQDFALLPWASVLRNAAFGLELRGVSKAEREERAMELVKLAGLEGFENALPHELSGGMKQRVGLARALATDPQILLMDEPFSAVDEQTRRVLQEQLLGIWESQRKTVVFITHSIEEAVLLADRVVVMSPRPGRVNRLETVPLDRPRVQYFESDAGKKLFMDETEALWDLIRGMEDSGDDVG